MNEKHLKCRECKVELENGCMMDYTHGAVFVGRYAQVDAIPTGKLKRLWGIAEAKFSSTRRVHALRCPSCNVITLVAQSEPDSEDFLSAMNARTNTILIFTFSLLFILAVMIGVAAALGVI